PIAQGRHAPPPFSLMPPLRPIDVRSTGCMPIISAHAPPIPPPSGGILLPFAVGSIDAALTLSTLVPTVLARNDSRGSANSTMSRPAKQRAQTRRDRARTVL